MSDRPALVSFLSHFPYAALNEDLEEALDGWDDVCGEPDSIVWLRARGELWPYATVA